MHLKIRALDPDLTEGLEMWPGVQVFGHGISWAPYRIEGGPDRTPLFTIKGLPMPLPTLVAGWRSLREEHPGFIDTYLPVLHGAPMPASAQFLFRTSAVEALHSSIHGESAVPPSEYGREQADLIRKIQASGALSGSDLNTLKGHLARTNFYSLPDRLGTLARALPEEFVRAARLRRLSGEVPGLRNKVAHGRTLTGDDRSRIVSLNESLASLLDASLLRLLGPSLDGLAQRLREPS